MPSNSLEQEAMDRVRRMYASFDSRRAASPRAAEAERPHNEAGSDTRRSSRTSERESPPTPSQSNGDVASEPLNDHAKQPTSLLDIFMKDRDQSLILLLLVLLMKDGADMNLMLALMYLLL